ncbi:MAG: lysylphosphatidylglycerol synthase domain-containing protein [Bacteroidota bacterium]|nr:lysylphosphatidylglycerol synthase domain-containing protein [Bacteroidota bacterium]
MFGQIISSITSVKVSARTYKVFISIVSLIGLVILAYQLNENDKIKNLLLENRNKAFTINGALLLGSIIVLAVVNQLIEAYKWKSLLQSFAKISLMKSMRGVLVGNSISILLPNRTGDFIGRASVLNSRNQIAGAAMSILGSWSQLLVTILFGTTACILWVYGQINVLYFIGLFILMLVVNLSLVYAWLSLPRIIKHAKPLKIKFIKTRRWALFVRKGRTDMFLALRLSMLRFATFAFQFYLFLVFYQGYIPISVVFVPIVLMFFLQTISPSGAISEVFVRSMTTALIFSSLGIEYSAVTASLSLWLVNVVAPAIVGYMVAIPLAWLRTGKYGKLRTLGNQS